MSKQNKQSLREFQKKIVKQNNKQYIDKKLISIDKVKN